MKLSRIARNSSLSLTRTLFNMSKEYDDVINYTLGDPDVPTPDSIKLAGCEAIMKNRTRYSQNAGLLELRTQISRYIEYHDGLAYNPVDEVFVSVGAMEGLYLTLMALIDKGDEIIIPAPYYVNYKQMVEMCGGVAVIVEDMEHWTDLQCSVDSIRAAITEKTKAIIINTPSNPTGKILSDEFLREIAELAKAHDLIIIADEVYKCLVYDNAHRPLSIASLPDMKNRTVYINSLSKEFCMTGWRIGYVLACQELIDAITKLQENVAACAPLPSQYAAIEALRTDVNYSSNMVSVFQERRDILMQEIAKIPLLRCDKPRATFYAMVDISKTQMKSFDFAVNLLKNNHVAVVPGVTYGNMCDNYIRIAFTLEANLIIEGVRRIGLFVNNLQ